MPLLRSMTGAQVPEHAGDPRRLAASIGQFVSLTKPRVMSLAVFTAFAGLWLAPRHLDLAGTLLALTWIALGSASAGALNMWYDADIDALMRRGRFRVARERPARHCCSVSSSASALPSPARSPSML